MRILAWHVHGSWMTSFVSGSHDYLLPVSPGRDRDGLGRATSWDWPESVHEVPVDQLADERCDLVVLQRPHEAELLERWTGWRVGRDIPAVYVEHNAPTEHAVSTRHPVSFDPRLRGLTVVHVTHFNAMAWDCGDATTVVIEHGVPDPGYRYSGELASLGVVVNEPVRRWRVAGTDIVLDLATEFAVAVHGMGLDALEAIARERGVPLTECVDLDQQTLHERLPHHRIYLHPYRWTSLGLALVEAMMLGMPVLALSTTEAPEAVPADAGVVSCDLVRLREAARRWLADPAEARERGLAGREHAVEHYSLKRFLDDWDHVFREVTS